MRSYVRAFGALALAAPMLVACATRGDVRRAVEGERAARVAADTALRAELAVLRTDMGVLQTDMQSLRRDLQNLRTEFRAEITALEEGLQFAMPVNFEFDRDEIRPQDEPMIQRFAQVVQRYYPNATITVEGFADPAGAHNYNLALSRRRAEAVRAYLATMGVQGDQLRAVGYGSARQVVPGAWGDEPGGETNRRVVFVVESRGERMGEGIALTGGNGPS